MNTGVSDRMAWRLRVYPLVILIALAGALVVASLSYEPDDLESRLGGDYPAFYGAGTIVRAGDWDELYSPERQQTQQAGLIDDTGGYLYFSYPPFVAGGYGVLAMAPYQWSFLVHTALMAGALALAVLLLTPWLPRWPRLAMVVVVLAFYPVFRAVVGGQNTTLTILLLALAARLDHEQRPVLAGLAAAGLLFKPQYGLLVLPLLVLARRWRMAAGWGLGAVALYGLSAVLMGGPWVADWWSQAGEFSDLNASANGANFISLPGFLENAFGSGGAILGYGLAAAVGAAVALVWWRHPRDQPMERWASAAAAAVVVAPQTLYYDAGMLLLALVVVLPRLGSPVWRWILVGAVLSWTQVAAGALGWSPLGPISIVLAAGFVAAQAGIGGGLRFAPRA